MSIFILKLLCRLHREGPQNVNMMGKYLRTRFFGSNPGHVHPISSLLGSGYLLFLSVLVSPASMKWGNIMVHTARGCGNEY